MSVLDQLRLMDIGWRDMLEIVVASYAIYRVLLLLHRRRAMQILIGVIILAVAYAIGVGLRLTMITFLLSQVFSYAAFALLIVFAPELRAALAQIGRSPLSRFLRSVDPSIVADEVSDAAERLSRHRVGAIIAIERDVPLQEYIATGSPMNAKVSADLITTIFTPYSPLHDGAVIIRGDTIVGAGCILPLSEGSLMDRNLGTRHRAALGLTEETDAIVVVVSEETSAISAAVGAKLWRSLTVAQLREVLAGGEPRGIAEGERAVGRA
ncbi:MAG TPA: diadenylate cyclase CdaA [Gemmatimonadaceae bacterium]|nr:diadenylate cyclase CdaA [Gemmatimonadaceae bacterium]